jgi:S-adenosylmethionine/arginine decarboxylase-like enzyme
MIKNLSKSLHVLNRKNPWGYSTSLDLKRCNDKIRDKKYILDYTLQLCDLIEMKRFGPCHINHFGEGDKLGYSMFQLIETSNISGHFCNESNSAYLDIFSCKPYNVLELERFSKNFFDAESFVSITSPRY